MALADYKPLRSVVAFNGGEVSVRGLALQDVSVLMHHHLADINVLVEALGAEVKNEITSTLIAQHAVTLIKEAPGLVANLIALAADEPDQVDTVRSMGMAVQIRIIEQIAKLTFDEAGGPKKFAESLVGLLRGLRPPK